MALDASELDRQRQLRTRDPDSANPARAKVEEVVRTFSDDEKMEIVNKKAVVIQIGTPARDVTLRPLSLRQVTVFLPRLKMALGPLLLLFRERKAGDPPIPMAMIIDALVEHMDDLPDLIWTILERGNTDIDKLWLEEHMDFAIDMQQILPIFLKQNALNKLFNLGKARSESVTSLNGDGVSSSEKSTDQMPTTGSSVQSSSAASTTDGPTTTS